MDKDNKIEELLKPLQIPFTTQLTESNDEFRHAHGFFECFYVTEGSIYHECNGKNEILTEGERGLSARAFITGSNAISRVFTATYSFLTNL